MIYQDLVNEETLEAVEQIYQSEKISNLLASSRSVELKTPIFQQKMPTLDVDGNLTERRKAPAGMVLSAFIKSLKHLKVSTKMKSAALETVRTLNSGANTKIISSMMENDWPVVMLTTTKTKSDKKGGQLGILQRGGVEYITIIEKAQASNLDSLDYLKN